MNVEGRTANEIFGYIDNLKLRSCMTLFGCASNDGLFRDALDKYFDSEADQLTLDILESTKMPGAL